MHTQSSSRVRKYLLLISAENHSRRLRRIQGSQLEEEEEEDEGNTELSLLGLVGTVENKGLSPRNTPSALVSMYTHLSQNGGQTLPNCYLGDKKAVEVRIRAPVGRRGRV